MASHHDANPRSRGEQPASPRFWARDRPAHLCRGIFSVDARTAPPTGRARFGLSPASEKTLEDRPMREIGHFIGGKPAPGTSGKFGDVHNPAAGEVVARVALASTAEVSDAVASATAAWPAWAATPPLRRARVMFKFKELLERDRKELSAIITEEHGKVLSDADGEVQRRLEVVEFACGIPHLLKGEFTEAVGTGIDAWSIRQPLGVMPATTPSGWRIDQASMPVPTA